MKKILLLFLFPFCFEFAAYSQPCTLSTDTAHLDMNNARVVLQASGDFFWDRNDAGFFVPKTDPSQPQTATIFAGGLWLGGLDPGGNLKFAAQKYGANSGKTDWWPGPLDPDDGTSNASNCSNFDKLWKINRSDIIAQIADYASDGDIDGPVPPSVLAWPGRDNPLSLAENGFTLPVGAPLAPFIDRNENGKYEPLLGDYPNITGDQAIWWVFNDEGGGAVHGETFGVPIRAEVQALAYAFEGANNENLANTTFYDFTIINRALEDIDSLYISMWLDADLGCHLDDYIGCISEEKMAFVYNQDAQDGQPGCSCPGGVATFCDDIPVTGIKVLRGPKNEAGDDTGFSSFVYTNSGGNVNIPPGTIEPDYDIEYYRYMSGKWKDGTHITFGWYGYDPSDPQPYNYVYDGNPSDVQGWSECTENSLNYDRQLLVNSGPVNLQPGGRTSICYAVMNKFGIQYPCPNVTPLIEMGHAVEQFYASLTPTNETIFTNNAVNFYPNPLVSEGKLTTNGEIFESVRLFSLDGRILREYNYLNTTELTIERSGLPSGFYLYSALLRNGQLASGKIVIQ